MKYLQVFALFFLASLSGSSYSYIITSYDLSVFNTDTNVMNASLGIDGTFIIEDFEDTILVSGLTISDHADGTGSPMLVSNSVIAWDGTSGFVAGLSPNIPIDDPIFSFSNPVEQFGLGISDYQPELYGSSQILVNGINLGNIPVSGGLRDGYFFITAGAGESINTVTFLQAGNDSIMYDHLAIKYGSVPEPSTILLLSLGFIGIGLNRKRKV